MVSFAFLEQYCQATIPSAAWADEDVRALLSATATAFAPPPGGQGRPAHVEQQLEVVLQVRPFPMRAASEP